MEKRFFYVAAGTLCLVGLSRLRSAVSGGFPLPGARSAERRHCASPPDIAPRAGRVALKILPRSSPEA